MFSKEALVKDQYKEEKKILERQDAEETRVKWKPRLITGGKGPPGDEGWLGDIEIGSSFLAKHNKELFAAVLFDKVWEGERTTCLRIHKSILLNREEGDEVEYSYVVTRLFSIHWELVEVL